MCWSAQVSLNSFLFSTFGCIFAYMNGYPLKELLVIFSFVAMQLNEYFLWKNLRKKNMNTFFSMMAAVLIFLQPYFAINVMDSKTPLLKKIKITLYTLWSLFVLFAFYKSFIGSKNTLAFSTSVAKNGHLSWDWLPNNTFGWRNMFYFAMIIIPLVISKSWLVPFVVVTLLLSLYTYHTDKTWGSVWCWIVNITVIFIVLKILFYDHVCKLKQV